MMSLRRNSFGSLLCAAGSLALLIAVACTPPTVSVTPDFPVTLPSPNQTVNLDSIRAQVARAPQGGEHTRMREASTNACTLCGSAVTITAYPDARKVDPDHPPKAPLFVATMTNNGPYRTKMYNLEPSTVVPFYLVYVVNSRGTTGFEVRPVNRGGTGLMPVVAAGTVKGCGHERYPALDADFRDCEWHSRVSMAAPKTFLSFATMTSLLEASAAQPRVITVDESVAWISCDPSGCCTL